ncbi:hypothetical protein L2E82_09159 [Cichorium intybus]|uniref:Uncharacterized protein n=1 Tax=Cichorium intybus TaxID=13427 RepID=A0ACB9G8P0_CICIN|nr:hypothetical protein L2E82_09159 [Cichorium intybus]
MLAKVVCFVHVLIPGLPSPLRLIFDFRRPFSPNFRSSLSTALLLNNTPSTLFNLHHPSLFSGYTLCISLYV